jgi:hypothetical protein
MDYGTAAPATGRVARLIVGLTGRRAGAR